MKKRKQTPADYGQFYFRIPHGEKPLLEDEIRKVLVLLSESNDDDSLKPKRNDLIVRALRRGLKSIERDLRKK